MCNLIRKSLALEIVNFVNTFNTNNNSRLSSFTTSAFIQSRNKIKPEVFKHLSSTLSYSRKMVLICSGVNLFDFIIYSLKLTFFVYFQTVLFLGDIVVLFDQNFLSNQ